MGSLLLKFSNSLVDWFSINDTFSNWSFSSSSSYSDSVNNIPLFLFESKSSSLIKSRWSGDSVNDWELSIFPSSNSHHKPDNIRLFFPPYEFHYLSVLTPNNFRVAGSNEKSLVVARIEPRTSQSKPEFTDH